MKFNEPHPGYSSRSILVTEIPTIGESTIVEEMLITINYTGPGSGTKGIALDNHVMPLLRAAPDLLRAAEGVIDNWERGDLAAAVRRLARAIAAAKGGRT